MNAMQLGRPLTRAPRGFTLIEVMITVAIIGILAAVALPAYTEQVKRSKRSNAQTVMLQGAQFAQRYYNAKNTYSGLQGGTGTFASSNYKIAPNDGGTANYNITFALNGSGFIITAAPNTSNFTDSKCGSLTLTDTGVKGVTGTDTVANCWR